MKNYQAYDNKMRPLVWVLVNANIPSFAWLSHEEVWNDLVGHYHDLATIPIELHEYTSLNEVLQMKDSFDRDSMITNDFIALVRKSIDLCCFQEELFWVALGQIHQSIWRSLPVPPSTEHGVDCSGCGNDYCTCDTGANPDGSDASYSNDMVIEQMSDRENYNDWRGATPVWCPDENVFMPEWGSDPHQFEAPQPGKPDGHEEYKEPGN